MGDTTRYSLASSHDQVYILSKIVEALEDEFQFAELARPGRLPRHEGSTVRWILDENIDPDLDAGSGAVYNAIDRVTTGITYATRDEFNEASYAPGEVEEQIHTYGAFIPMRRWDLDNLVQGVADDIADRLRYLGHLVIDSRIRGAADGSMSGFLPDGGAGSDNVDSSDGPPATAAAKLTATRIINAVTSLRKVNARTYSNGLYAAVIDATQENDLMTEPYTAGTTPTTWHEVNKFVGGATGQPKLLNGTLGAIGGMMLMRSNNINHVVANKQLIAVCLAQDGVGNVTMETMKPSIIINRAGGQSMSDPYRAYATVAFTVRMAPALLRGTNPSSCVRLIETYDGT